MNRAGRLLGGLVLAGMAIVHSTPALAAPKRRPRKPPVAPVQPPAPIPQPEPSADEPSPSAGEIAVTVVEVAGSQAYLTPGTKGGVRKGAKVVIRRQEYTVVQATESFSAVAVTGESPREGDKGRATRLSETTTDVVELEKPKPASTWAHAWTEPIPPASRQTPRFVPLGGGDRDRRLDVRLSASAGASLPLSARGANLVRTSLDARLHAEPFRAPLALDVDLSLQRWFDGSANARAGDSARPTLYVRQLLASYDGSGLFAGLGRMRYAAATLGTLDGARAGADIGGGFAIGAFGGALPHPLSGAPSLVAQRFGVEMTYRRPDAAARPDAALVASGSTFDGGVDERRLSGVFNLYPGESRIGGFFQVDAFDRGNPWQAKPVELTAAGVDGSVRSGAFQAGGRVDLRKPERSRWLASYLPESWLCVTGAAPAKAIGTCGGSATTFGRAMLDVGVELERVSLLLSAGRTFDLSLADAPSATFGVLSGRVVRIAEHLRFDAAGTYSTATYVDMTGASAGPGLSLLGEALDVSAYYRVASLRYAANSENLIQHAAGGTVLVVPSPALLFVAQGEAMAGGDARALLLFGAVTWRPQW